MNAKRRLRPVEHLGNLESYFFDGDVHETLAELTDVLNGFKEDGYTNIYMESETKYNYGDDRYTVFSITGQRMETQEEADKRAETARKAKITRAKRSKAAILAAAKKERETYLRLRKKFEGS